MSKSLALNLSNRIGYPVATLEETKVLYPQLAEYLPETLAEDECVYWWKTLVVEYEHPVGSTVKVNNDATFTVVDNLVNRNVEHNIIVSEAGRDRMLKYCIDKGSPECLIYFADKEAFFELVEEGLPSQFDNTLTLFITDNSALEKEAYMQDLRERIGARVIVTITVAVLLMVMLYFLQRSVIRSRIELVSVYRLLGVPKRELIGMFILESALLLCVFVLPFALITWGVIAILGSFGIATNIFNLTWYWVLAAIGFISLYLELITVLPLLSLVCKAPAKLATKYDF